VVGGLVVPVSSLFLTISPPSLPFPLSLTLSLSLSGFSKNKAIFLKRARLPYTVLGGASLGAADGVATHVYKGYSEGIYDKGPKGVVEEVAGKKL